MVYFLIPEGVLKFSSLFGAIEIFEHANNFVSRNGARPYYDIKLIGTDTRQSVLNTHININAAAHQLDKARADLIIVPGISQGNDLSSAQNKALIDWMTHQYKEGCELASLCTGAFMLAATGLLANKECATHWAAANTFRDTYPDVKLCTDKIVTDSNGIYTAGGANSSLNLILYLIEKFNGHEAALYCAKILQIDIDRNSQLPFMIFKGQRNHDDSTIQQVQDFIEANVGERVTVEFLAAKFAISKRNFIRRFKKATNSPPIEYIQKTKIEAAKRSLELKRKNVNEVMYSIGYTDVKAFRTIFKKLTGYSPTDYQQKFAS